MSARFSNLPPVPLDYEQWLDMYFGRSAVALSRLLDWEVGDQREVTESGDAEILVEHMTRLFRNIDAEAERLSEIEVIRGLGFLTAPGDFNLAAHIADQDVPLAKTLDCVRAMYYPFVSLVVRYNPTVVPDVFYMWWEWIIDAIDAIEVRDAIFRTLAAILDSPHKLARVCALHGLGHLRDTRRHDLVQQYIEVHRRTLGAQELRWIEECRDGTVL